MRRSSFLLGPLSITVLAVACAGTEPADVGGTGGSSSASSGSGGASATSSSGAGGMTGSSASGSGGATVSSSGSGGSDSCPEVVMQTCYDGPAGTQGVGECQPGVQVCDAAGVWGACMGSVLPAVEACDGVDNDCNGAVDEGCEPPWVKGFFSVGGTAAKGVALDAAGNLHATGWFSSAEDFGGGPLSSVGYSPDGFIAKYSPSGAHLWSMRFGGPYDERGYGIAVDAAGNVYVVGGISTPADFGGVMVSTPNYDDAFVAKLSPAGAVLWLKTFGTKYGATGQSVAIDPTGGVVVTGSVSHDYASPTVDLGGGPRPTFGIEDVFVLKLAENGDHVWSTTFGGTSYDRGYRVAVDGSGNALIGGMVRGTIDFGAGPTTGGGFYDEAFLVKLSPTGALLWSKRYAGSGGSNGQFFAAAFDAGGNALMCGPMTAPIDFGAGPVMNGAAQDVFIAKYTPAGDLVWGVANGDAGGAGCHTIAADPSGDVLIGGALGIASPVQPWLMLRKGSDGAKVWSRSFAATKDANVWSARPAPGGKVAIAMSFSGTVDLGVNGMLPGGLTDDGAVGIVQVP